MNNDNSKRLVTGPKDKKREDLYGGLKRVYAVDEPILEGFLKELRKHIHRRDIVVLKGINQATYSDVIHALVALATSQPDGILTAITHVKDDVGCINWKRTWDDE